MSSASYGLHVRRLALQMMKNHYLWLIMHEYTPYTLFHNWKYPRKHHRIAVHVNQLAFITQWYVYNINMYAYMDAYVQIQKYISMLAWSKRFGWSNEYDGYVMI